MLRSVVEASSKASSKPKRGVPEVLNNPGIGLTPTRPTPDGLCKGCLAVVAAPGSALDGQTVNVTSLSRHEAWIAVGGRRAKCKRTQLRPVAGGASASAVSDPNLGSSPPAAPATTPAAGSRFGRRAAEQIGACVGRLSRGSAGASAGCAAQGVAGLASFRSGRRSGDDRGICWLQDQQMGQPGVLARAVGLLGWAVPRRASVPGVALVGRSDARAAAS